MNKLEEGAVDLGINIHNTLLPSRACLTSVRDLACEARLIALKDAVRSARKLARNATDADAANVAAIACLWEAVNCMELAANTAAPWVDSQINVDNGPWVEMIRYDAGRANRFYESSHKWTDERFEVLSGHRARPHHEETLLTVLRDEVGIDEGLADALQQAGLATAKFLRRRFLTLRAWWVVMRSYAAAYEHGCLFIPAAGASFIDEQDNPVPFSVMAWMTKKDEVLVDNEGTIDSVIDAAEAAGHLAIDLAHHVADARLRIVDSVGLSGSGNLQLGQWKDPFPYWFERGDVNDETLATLRRGFHIAWIREDEQT